MCNTDIAILLYHSVVPVFSKRIKTRVSLVLTVLTELLIACKDDVTVFALPGEVKNITVEGPIAVPEDGVPPYSVMPDPNATISINGTATTVEMFMYTVTDAIGNSTACNITLSIRPGEGVRTWISAIWWCGNCTIVRIFQIYMTIPQYHSYRYCFIPSLCTKNGRSALIDCSVFVSEPDTTSGQLHHIIQELSVCVCSDPVSCTSCVVRRFKLSAGANVFPGGLLPAASTSLTTIVDNCMYGRINRGATALTVMSRIRNAAAASNFLVATPANHHVKGTLAL